MMGKYEFVKGTVIIFLYDLVACTPSLLLGFIGFALVCEVCFVLEDDFLLRFEVGYLLL